MFSLNTVDKELYDEVVERFVLLAKLWHSRHDLTIPIEQCEDITCVTNLQVMKKCCISLPEGY